MTSLNPVFTCGNQVMEAILLHQNVTKKQAYDLTIELFEKVKLPRPKDIFKSYPHQISGGQKQRVMIAMAMSCNPSVLIADEPTTALDVTVQATILELMRKLKDENDTSIIFITHDLGVIAEIADRVLVMYHGQIVEQGTVFNIFTNPKHPYTKGLLACRPKLDIRLKVLPVVSDFMATDGEGKMTEKEVHKFDSVGEAIMQSFVSAEETKKRQEELKKKFPVLIVRNLKTYFPINKGLFTKPTEFVKAVDDVSFEVYPGETLGLVGESGCGKTTLGRTILRLIEPTSGDIMFDGKNIVTMGYQELRKKRKDMQIIFQDPYSSLNPRLPIGEAIIEPMRVHGILESDFARKKKALELLDTVSLKHTHFNRYPHEFSGGQRQRICIARALALNPKFIICDESVSALDVSVQAQVLNLLNSLKAQFNFTYIFISHDLSVVKFMSDRIIVMNKGKIEEEGYADEIYEHPKTEYTQSLINSIPKGEIEDLKLRQLKRRLELE
jgi:peptide/nickel transport system ATP-binding protein